MRLGLAYIAECKRCAKLAPPAATEEHAKRNAIFGERWTVTKSGDLLCVHCARTVAQPLARIA